MEKIFSPCWKKFFFQIFLLYLHQNLLVRPQRIWFNPHPILSSDLMAAYSVGAKVSILRYFLYFPTYLLYLFWFMQWIPMNFCVHSMFYLLVQASERLLQGTVEVVGNSKFSKAHIPIFLSRYNTSPWPWLKGNSWTFLCRMKCWIGALWCTAVLNLCSYQKSPSQLLIWMMKNENLFTYYEVPSSYI